MRTAAIMALLPVLAFLVVLMDLSERFRFGRQASRDADGEDLEQDGIGW